MADAMTRPIRWDVIENNYDRLIKYATAIRGGTASTEAPGARSHSGAPRSRVLC
ncbi:Tn3 family transposase [Streptomyces sp. NPDC059037]|uniref:Tn3 family transposase n=1 Tax=Streptomyces sp. NPDC059037 TaxID=3346710 RepID=UPI00368AF53C